MLMGYKLAQNLHRIIYLSLQKSGKKNVFEVERKNCQEFYEIKTKIKKVNSW